MRCAIYTRFSTDKQDVQSIETQLMMCRQEIARKGWDEVACFTDAAESAATLHRPGMQALLAAVAAGGIDIVYADVMDRLSRSQADIAMLFERLRFRGIVLATRKEGHVTPLHIGMMGTINAEQLSATSEKTRDALVRRHAMGKNPGGSAYGYEQRIEHDGNGERIRGLQQIVPAEAAVVVRIFDDYAVGMSPIAITRRLNAEGAPSPRCGKTRGQLLRRPSAWTPNTLTGNAARGTGILNNPLYVGLRPYGKQTYRKNPDTGKRHAFINPEEKRADVIDVPELRILSVELWERVKARQASLARSPTSKAATPALEAVEQLVLEELTFREDRRIRTALRMGRLNTVKTLAGYDFTFQPSLDRARILALAELNFVARCEVVHLLGPPGTGKSHLASALGVEAIKAIVIQIEGSSYRLRRHADLLPEHVRSTGMMTQPASNEPRKRGRPQGGAGSPTA